MFNREFQRDVFRLFHAYPFVYGYQFHLEEMHREILAAFAEASQNEPDFYDIGDLVHASASSKDILPRKCAWISSQVLGRAPLRAIAVNQRILKSKKVKLRGSIVTRYTSPLINSLDCYGLVSEMAWAERLDKQLCKHACRESAVIDAMLVDIPSNKIFVVNAVSAKQVQQYSKNLLVGSAEPNLFAPNDRPLGNAIIPGRAARLAISATEVISLACPDIQVVPIVMVVDDEECSWFFQANRLPFSNLRGLPADDSLCLDDLPIEESILSFVGGTGRRDVELDQLRIGPTTKYLHALPVDRATRPLMLLDRLVARQEAMPSELAICRGRELQQDVQLHFSIAFDRDMRRHDLEDCLRQAGWVESPATDRSSFYLTASGLALTKFVQQRFSPDSVNLGPDVIFQMQRQAQLEIEYQRRMSR